MTTASDSLSGILEQLGSDVRKDDKNDQWQAKCPCHDDEKWSLSLGLGDDKRILLHCHAGCKAADVANAFGLAMRDLFPPSNGNGNGNQIAETYDYNDGHGKLLFQVCRMRPKDFKQRRPNGNGGWIWATKGIKKPLYHLPQLLAADPERCVFLAEGEKDVHSLEALGFVASTNAGGADKWTKRYTSQLKGRRICVVPDNDEPGRKHAEKIATSLQGVAASIKVLMLPSLPPKGDVSDWIAAGGTAEELKQLVRECGEWQPNTDTTNEGGEISSIHATEGRTDAANARRFADRFADRVRYCDTWGKWLVWDSKRWAIDQSREVDGMAKKIAHELFVEISDVASKEQVEHKSVSAMWRFASRSANANGVRDMVALARSEPRIPVKPSELDCDPWLLSVANGTLDLRTGNLQMHDPADLITKLAPIEYHEEADCPLWDETIDAIFSGDDELITYLQRFLGYCLTGDTREQVLQIWWGDGSNGKSLIIDLLLYLMGDYGHKAPSDLLLAKRGDRHPTAKADLFGKRFVACVESDDGRRLDESVVKELSGDERITARRMKEDYWGFDATHKLILATNAKPTVKGTDHGIWRRLALVPFAAHFWDRDKGESGPPELKADKQRGEKLRKELSGILRWMIKGCLDWQKFGLAQPKSVRAATAEYRVAEDVVGQFLSECCHVESTFDCRASDLFQRYKEWCETNGERSATQRSFGQVLTGRGFERFTNNGTRYRGVAIATEGTERL